MTEWFIQHIPASIVGKAVYFAFAIGFAFFFVSIAIGCTAFALWLRDRMRE